MDNIKICYFLYGSHKIDEYIIDSLNFMESIPIGGQFFLEAIKDS